MEESVKDQLLEIYPHITFSFEKKLFESKERKQAYCANIRVSIMRKLLEKGIEMLIYLDVDSIVRNDLSQLIESLFKYDIAIMKRSDSGDINVRFLTGVIGVNNCKKNIKIIDFIKSWEKNVSIELFSWYSDQSNFSKTYDSIGSTIKLLNLPKQYIDWDFSNDSSIWVGKYKRKTDSKRYVLEEKFYQKMAEDKKVLAFIIKNPFTISLATLVDKIYFIKKNIYRQLKLIKKRLVTYRVNND